MLCTAEEGSISMMPNSLIQEYLVRERIQEWHRQAQQQRLLARLPRSHFSLSRYLIGRLGTFLVILGTSMQRVEQQSWPVVEKHRQDETPCMKGHDMNLQQEAREQRTMTTEREPKTPEEVLAQEGFTAEEIVALLWLEQWYQKGGSDRAQFVRSLEFLKLLVRTGELEV
jgi:hypothetical protein